MDEHGPTGSVVRALVALSRNRAAEAGARPEPRPEAHPPEVVRPRAEWQGLVAVVVGLTVAAVCAGVLGSQLWHVKRQLERQQRVRTLVAEAGLPPHFVPKIQSSNRWAIGSSLGVVFGLFWVVWGVIRYRDEQRCRALLSEPRSHEGDEAPPGADPAPGVTSDLADSRRPARRRSGHRCHR